MTESKSNKHEAEAAEQAAIAASVADADPVLSTESASQGAFPEGTHPARPPAETHHSVERYVYKDNPDKPDPSTVAQVVEIKGA